MKTNCRVLGIVVGCSTAVAAPASGQPLLNPDGQNHVCVKTVAVDSGSSTYGLRTLFQPPRSDSLARLVTANLVDYLTQRLSDAAMPNVAVQVFGGPVPQDTVPSGSAVSFFAARATITIDSDEHFYVSPSVYRVEPAQLRRCQLAA